MNLKQKMLNGLLKVMVLLLGSGRKCDFGIVLIVMVERIRIKELLLSIWRRELLTVREVVAE